ncbi:hypothetical protein PTKIN_Ptkin05aG0119700 [Pterospermum kingtungense]
MLFARGGRRGFCSNYTAAPATFFGEATNIVRRGRSNAAASLPSDPPNPKKVSKDERRALIESFVSRYKSMNAGKFPSATAAQKEVGGSYYFIRKILQELEHKSKLGPSNGSYDSISGKVVSKEDKSFSVAETVATAVGDKDETCTEAMDGNMLDTNDKQLEADGVLQVYTLAEETSSEVVLNPQTPGSHSDFVLEENSSLNNDVESLEKQVDGKVEDAEIDASDKFLRVLDKQMVEASDQHLESEKFYKAESQGVQVYTLAEETSSEVVLKPQTPGSHSDFVLEENSVLKDDAKSLKKQVDDKVEGARIDASDKFLTVPEKQMVEASYQHLESEKYCKAESQGVQSEFGVVEGDILRKETEIGNAKDDEKEQTVSKELLDSGSPDLEAEKLQQSTKEKKYSRNSLLFDYISVAVR